MPKAIAIIVSASEGSDDGHIKLTTAVAIRPVNADSIPTSFESFVEVLGTENAQQLNSAILSKVKADALAKAGITLADADITTTKFS